MNKKISEWLAVYDDIEFLDKVDFKEEMSEEDFLKLAKDSSTVCVKYYSR